jgi:hypothetical protein
MNRFAPKLELPVVSTFVNTDEQNAIIANAVKGSNLAIRAFAGSSKTTTCVLVAEEVTKKSLYIAFNKSIAEEARAKFPSWVECKTLHSLAWGAVIKYSKSPMGQKLQGNFNLSDITISKPIPDVGLLKERINIANYVKGFCQSGATSIVEYVKSIDADVTQETLTDVETFWLSCINVLTTTKITHDVYLKLYHLSLPKLEYQVIYADEFQDSNPVTLAIFLDQEQYGTQLICVGDEYQAIYEWRGAINAFDYIPDTFVNMYLTESFRFTQEIADMAFKLTAIAGNTRPIIGKKVAPTNLPTGQEVVIVRNNSTGLSYILKAANEGKSIYAEMDLADLWSKLYHIAALMGKQTIKYPNKDLTQYSSWLELKEVGESLPEIKKLIRLTTQLGDGGLTANINRIKSCLVKEAALADTVITTAHKSKGLEWSCITLAYDMFYVKDGETIIDALLTNQTLNLIYVALTRGMYVVNIDDKLAEVLEDWRELAGLAAEIAIDGESEYIPVYVEESADKVSLVKQTVDADLPVQVSPFVVYYLYNTNKELLFIGVTVGIQRRLHTHVLQDSWFGEVDMKLTVMASYDSRLDAYSARKESIWGNQPIYSDIYKK